MCHANGVVPDAFSMKIWWVWDWSGPSIQPTPYFHAAGARPGFRSNSSFIVLACQFIVRV
jgi:hypothetical protein